MQNYSVGRFLERAVEEIPHEPFLFWEDEVYRYEEFNREVDKAAALWHSLGVRHGDRVAYRNLRIRAWHQPVTDRKPT